MWKAARTDCARARDAIRMRTLRAIRRGMGGAMGVVSVVSDPCWFGRGDARSVLGGGFNMFMFAYYLYSLEPPTIVFDPKR